MGMVRDLLMKLQLQDQMLILRLKLIHITDMAMATTDHTDITEDTMARDPLMTKLLLLVQTLMPMLMLGMVIMDMVMDMDTTDHTDTGDTMVRDLLRRPQLLDLMLMLGMDTMDTDGVDTMDTHTMAMDMDIGERSKSISTIRKHNHLFFEKMH